MLGGYHPSVGMISAKSSYHPSTSATLHYGHGRDVVIAAKVEDLAAVVAEEDADLRGEEPARLLLLGRDARAERQVQCGVVQYTLPGE